jgi:hypothetical protein
MPEFDQARAVQIDLDPAMIGMRYPTPPYLMSLTTSWALPSPVYWIQKRIIDRADPIELARTIPRPICRDLGSSLA